MKLSVKRYDELTLDELYDILKLRAAVFIVEQNCPYQDIDDKDKQAYHVFLSDETGLQAYLRVLDKGVSFDAVSIGRVIAVKRRCGLGTQLVKEGIRVAREQMQADRIIIEAQTYAKQLYEKLGFLPVSEEFLEDGIPHIRMRLTCTEDV